MKVPLPTYALYLQERGYHDNVDAPPNPFFKDCGELFGRTTDFVTEEEFDQTIQSKSGYTQPTQIICDALRTSTGHHLQFRPETFTTFAAILGY